MNEPTQPLTELPSRPEEYPALVMLARILGAVAPLEVEEAGDENNVTIFTCPTCGGDGSLTSDEVLEFRGSPCEFPIGAVGFQCYGVGEGHVELEKAFRDAPKEIAALRAQHSAAESALGTMTLEAMRLGTELNDLKFHGAETATLAELQAERDTVAGLRAELNHMCHGVLCGTCKKSPADSHDGCRLRAAQALAECAESSERRAFDQTRQAVRQKDEAEARYAKALEETKRANAELLAYERDPYFIELRKERDALAKAVRDAWDESTLEPDPTATPEDLARRLGEFGRDWMERANNAEGDLSDIDDALTDETDDTTVVAVRRLVRECEEAKREASNAAFDIAQHRVSIDAEIARLNAKRPLPREGAGARDGQIEGLRFALALLAPRTVKP